MHVTSWLGYSSSLSLAATTMIIISEAATSLLDPPGLMQNLSGRGDLFGDGYLSLVLPAGVRLNAFKH